MEYSEQFKEAAVEKFLLRGSKGASEICRDLGISTAAIYRWSRKCGRTPKMNEPRGPQDLSLEQKYKAVFEYEKLAEEKRGEFLRREGLHSDHLVKWEKEIQDCFINRDSEASITRAERAKWNQQMKELQRDLNRKEKALAETAALLILKKKADLIWGSVGSEGV